MENHLTEFKQIMQKEGLNEVVIDSFAFYYNQILKGATGKLSEKDINPPDKRNLIDYRDLKETPASFDKLAVIKLNGGLGTSMGLKNAKSLLKVKNDLTFLDIICKQILHLRKITHIKIPLLFMNSFNTHQDTLDFIKKYKELPVTGLPLDFLQNKFPRIKQKDLSPLKNINDKLNWNPPGHGEIYMAMSITGILNSLIEKGFRYAFLSNSDNLGAIVDKKILGYIGKNKIPFLMEVCKRRNIHRKGGHLAQSKKGKLLLREIAQCPHNEKERFQNINRYKYFNTNNIWIDLLLLKKKLKENNYFLPLSLIINPKKVEGEKIYQLESAMGAAISIFENSKALIVKNDRLAPVKKTNNLLAVQSDAYKLDKNYRIILNKNLEYPPKIELNPEYYQNIDDFYKHFPHEIPSLKKCLSLKIWGNVFFGKNVEIIGNVTINKDIKLENQKLENSTI